MVFIADLRLYCGEKYEVAVIPLVPSSPVCVGIPWVMLRPRPLCHRFPVIPVDTGRAGVLGLIT